MTKKKENIISDSLAPFFAGILFCLIMSGLLSSMSLSEDEIEVRESCRRLCKYQGYEQFYGYFNDEKCWCADQVRGGTDYTLTGWELVNSE